MNEDDEWVRAYRDGNLAAFEQLYAKYRSPVYAYVRRSVSHPDTADELFQDIWIKLLASLTRYERRGRFRSWLFSCAHNVIVDHYRKVSNRPEEELDADVPDSRNENPDDLAGRIDEALYDLPFEQRQAFYLREVLNCSIKDVGEIQGCTSEAARSRLRYAYSRLQDKLADLR